MGRPAARVTDPVLHPLPGMLTPGPGSLNVLIGGLPAWRGIPAAAAAGLQAAKAASDAVVQAAGGGLMPGRSNGVPSGMMPLARRRPKRDCCARSRSISSAAKPHG